MNVSQVFSKLVSSQKASSAGRTLLRQIVLIMVALLLTSLFLLVTGYDPWIVFKAIYKSISTDIGGTVRWMIPYGMMGLAVALTFRMNLFNMGVDGQLYLGAIGATYICMQLVMRRGQWRFWQLLRLPLLREPCSPFFRHC